jgi:hypothetical protein
MPRQFPRVERAARTSLPSRILSSQEGQTRGVSRPSGVNTRTYRRVTNELQFWHSGIAYIFLNTYVKVGHTVSPTFSPAEKYNSGDGLSVRLWERTPDGR